MHGEARYRLRNVRVPTVLIAAGDRQRLGINCCEELTVLDLEIADGQIAAIAHPGTLPPAPLPSYDRRGAQVWPGFADLHTHLDKGHIWPRSPNPDGSFEAALSAAIADSGAHWTTADLRPRMEFSLRCAYAHGTVALRTHLDAAGPLAETSFAVFRELRDAWRDRLTLQAVSLVSLDHYLTPAGERLADLVADSGGILGGVTFAHPELDRQLERTFELAEERGLALDLHVDESLDAEDDGLDRVARLAIARGFSRPIVCGHCCSLSVQPRAQREATLARVREAGITVVSLPLCNLYLQDRQRPGRHPRWRGIAPLRELHHHGVPVALASDNTRDPFYAYGDLDLLEVFRVGVRVGHLDHPVGDWPDSVCGAPARAMGLPERGRIGVGLPADLVLFRGRDYSELLARPESDRLVLRAGVAIDSTLPDYAELDALFA